MIVHIAAALIHATLVFGLRRYFDEIFDMSFCGSISARGLGGSTLAEGIRMSYDGLVNMSDRIRVC